MLNERLGNTAGAFRVSGLPCALRKPQDRTQLTPHLDLERTLLGDEPDRLDQATHNLPRHRGVVGRKHAGKIGDPLAIDFRQVRMQPRRGGLGTGKLGLELRLAALQIVQAALERWRRRAGHDRVHRPLDLTLETHQLLPAAQQPGREASACSRFQVAVNSATNSRNSSGSISRSRSAPSTVSSSMSRRTVSRFTHAVGPLLRAVEQPKCSAEILEKPPPHAPHTISPEKRYRGRCLAQNASRWPCGPVAAPLRSSTPCRALTASQSSSGTIRSSGTSVTTCASAAALRATRRPVLGSLVQARRPQTWRPM